MTSAKKPLTTPAVSGRLSRRLVAIVLTLTVVGGVVWGIAWMGEQARRGIGPRDRYALRFADIECNPPPNLDRAAFVAEVRYISNLPETFQSLDPHLCAELSTAFLAHPWVEEVKEVTVDATGAVRITLAHRVPVLAVRLASGELRVVDRHVRLLPRAAPSDGLPTLVSRIAPPPPRDGQAWPDATVVRAVDIVAAYHPRELEITANGWRLTMADGRTLIIEQ